MNCIALDPLSLTALCPNEMNWKYSSLCARLCVYTAGKRGDMYPPTYNVRCYPHYSQEFGSRLYRGRLGRAISW